MEFAKAKLQKRRWKQLLHNIYNVYNLYIRICIYIYIYLFNIHIHVCIYIYTYTYAYIISLFIYMQSSNFLVNLQTQHSTSQHVSTGLFLLGACRLPLAKSSLPMGCFLHWKLQHGESKLGGSYPKITSKYQSYVRMLDGNRGVFQMFVSWTV